MVGVTTSEVRRAERTQPLPEGEPPQHEMALGMPYVRALAHAGAVPGRAAAAARRRRAVAARAAAAVCLSGGPDLDPSAYGASPSPDLGPVEPALDLFELEVARVADAAGLPIFGICRGAQALNVARGGTLHQHLPAITDHSIDHRQTAPGWEETHQVRVDPDSRLAAILGADAPWVNSFHHQAVDRLGAGLRAVAWAPDGTVEGIEDERAVRAGRAVARRDAGPRWPTPPPVRGAGGRGAGRGWRGALCGSALLLGMRFRRTGRPSAHA